MTSPFWIVALSEIVRTVRRSSRVRSTMSAPARRPPAELDLVERRPDQRRARTHDVAVRAAVHVVVGGERVEGASIGLAVGGARAEQPAGEQHVPDRQDEHRQADRGEGEKAQPARAGAGELGVDDEIG